MIHTSRRSFVAGLSSLFAAPAIVSASSLMPISSACFAPIEFGSNNTLSIQMITREDVRLFQETNLFLKCLDGQYDSVLPLMPLDLKVTIACAAPFVAAKALEAPVTRRLWST